MKYTENYNLPLYEPNDLANLMDGYNESMNTLDSDLKSFADFEQAQDKQIEDLTTSVNQRIKFFDTFKDMISSTNLNIGDTVKTLGFYEIGDLGGCIYKIEQTAEEKLFVSTKTANNLYAVLNIDNFVNAAAFGIIADKFDDTNLTSALNFASEKNSILVFPAELNSSYKITTTDVNLIFKKPVIYNGTDCAIELANSKNIFIFCTAIVAESAIGIKYAQTSNKTIYNSNVYCNNITAKNGIVLDASTYGIFECKINIGEINATEIGVNGICRQESSSTTSFIGEIDFNILHIKAKQAVNFSAENSPSTVTGIHFSNCSFENSSNGLKMRGDCKMVKFDNLRVLEADSFTYIIDIEGAARYIFIHAASPVRIDKLNLSTTYSWTLDPIVIDGGIYSPTSYKFADSVIVSSLGRTFTLKNKIAYRQNSDFTFMDDSSSSYRCYSYFYNTSGNTVTLNDLTYFSPFGVNEIFVSQNVNNGSIIKIVSNGETIFDGSNYTASERETFKIEAFYDATSNAIRYAISKVEGFS